MTAADVTAALAAADVAVLRYETPECPCTGITAVVTRERPLLAGRGVLVAPWSRRLPAAQNALARGLVRDTDLTLRVAGAGGRPLDVRVLAWHAPGHAPTFYLAADGHFEGVESPYDTPTANADALVFGLAAAALLHGRLAPRAWCWGADWQTVPALVLLRERHLTTLGLHNDFDTFLGQVAEDFPEPRYAPFRHRTALQVGLETCAVVTTVNRGFADGLRTELLHTRVLAGHLQPFVGRVIGVDNANFVEPDPADAALADLLERAPDEGLRQLAAKQTAARAALPAAVARAAEGKVLCVAMGRRSSQKLHDVVAAAVRALLRESPALPVYVFFATTHSDAGSPARLRRVQELCAEFPANAGWSDGRVAYYPQLMAAGSFNVLCSLWAPHEAAFQSTIVPVARAVEGLAAQVCPPTRVGVAGRLADRWHAPGAAPNGLTFREDPGEPDADAADLRALLEESPAPRNGLSERLTAALAAALREAVALRLTDPHGYGRLVSGAVRTQQARDWHATIGGVFALVEAARTRGRL